METLTIDNKNFVVIEQKEFDKLQLLAAQKNSPVKKTPLVPEKSMPTK